MVVPSLPAASRSLSVARRRGDSRFRVRSPAPPRRRGGPAGVARARRGCACRWRGSATRHAEWTPATGPGRDAARGARAAQTPRRQRQILRPPRRASCAALSITSSPIFIRSAWANSDARHSSTRRRLYSSCGEQPLQDEVVEGPRRVDPRQLRRPHRKEHRNIRLHRAAPARGQTARGPRRRRPRRPAHRRHAPRPPGPSPPTPRAPCTPGLAGLRRWGCREALR